MTSLPLILAEELDADWSKVQDRAGAADRGDLRQSGLSGHDVHRGLQRGDELLHAAAHVRRAGAPACCSTTPREELGVPVEELTTEPSVVVHAKSGRRLSYGEIAAFARNSGQGAGDQAGAAQESRRLPPDRQGRDAGRAAGQGQRHAPATASTAGARTCSTARCCARRSKARCRTRSTTPRPRRSPASCGSSGLPYGVGVVAETPWAAFDARRALTQSVTWSRTGTAWGFDSDKGIDALRGRRQEPRRGRPRDWSAHRRRRAAQCRRPPAPWRRVSLRLCLSRADGAAERGRVGVAGGRCGRDLGRHAEPDHRDRSAGQAPRHPARAR